jgi:putative hydrolase of the HAD superfamily
MLRAILFDMGGTLDGDGQHWLDRFVRLYGEAGFDLPRETIRQGFDYAERRSATDTAIMRAGFDALVRQHLRWQFELHGFDDHARVDQIARAFLIPVREAGKRNVTLLSELHDLGIVIGVVSNACGNVQTLCDDLGYSPFLSFVIDSRLVGVAKPDPAIYAIALEKLGFDAPAVMMVGDSYERDIVPAHGLGMQTAWLVADASSREPGVADLRLGNLAELTSHVRQREQLSA